MYLIKPKLGQTHMPHMPLFPMRFSTISSAHFFCSPHSLVYFLHPNPLELMKFIPNMMVTYSKKVKTLFCCCYFSFLSFVHLVGLFLLFVSNFFSFQMQNFAVFFRFPVYSIWVLFIRYGFFCSKSFLNCYLIVHRNDFIMSRI